MAAGKVDLIIEKGATFRKTFKWLNSSKQPIDISAWKGRMQIRSSTYGSIIASLTTENGGIELGADGTIKLYISDTATSAITYQGNAVYDLELIEPASVDPQDPPPDVTKFLRGSVSFVEEVTK
jgi:hypothetical protein